MKPAAERAHLLLFCLSLLVFSTFAAAEDSPTPATLEEVQAWLDGTRELQGQFRQSLLVYWLDYKNPRSRQMWPSLFHLRARYSANSPEYSIGISSD